MAWPASGGLKFNFIKRTSHSSLHTMHEHFVCPYGCPTVCKSRRGLTYHTWLVHSDANRVDRVTVAPSSALPSLPSSPPPPPSPPPPSPPPPSLPPPSPPLLPSLPPLSPSPSPPPHSPSPPPEPQGLQEQRRKIYHLFL